MFSKTTCLVLSHHAAHYRQRCIMAFDIATIDERLAKAKEEAEFWEEGSRDTG